MFLLGFPAPIVLTFGGQALQGRENVVRARYTTSTTSSTVFELYGMQASLSPGDFGSWIAPKFGDIGWSSSDIADNSEGEPKERDAKGGLDLNFLMSKLWVSATSSPHLALSSTNLTIYCQQSCILLCTSSATTFAFVGFRLLTICLRTGRMSAV